MLGRIGLDVYAKHPPIVYANVENANTPGMSDANRLKELREGESSTRMIGEEVYRSDDGGKTWKEVSPDKQRIGGGKTWQEIKNNLPTQPVYDLKIHPRERDLIVATHGRGIFITDISALEEVSDKTLAADFHLFDVESKVKWQVRGANDSSFTNFDGESEPNGVMINYFLKSTAQGDVTVKVMQGSRVVAETKGPNAAGMNQVLWNMRAAAGKRRRRLTQRSAARCRPRSANTRSS